MGTARDIALIFLSLEALILGLVPLILFAALAYGVHRLRGWTIHALRGLTGRLLALQARVEGVAARIVSPFIAVRSRWHQLATMQGYLIQKLTLGRR